MFITMLSMFTSNAFAGAEIEFKTQRPVIITVDGRQAALTGNLTQRARNLEAGTHEVVVKGVFGKTLFEAEMDLPEGTITEAEWRRGELSVLDTRWLDGDLSEQADEDEVEVPREPDLKSDSVEPPLAIPQKPRVQAPPTPSVAPLEPAPATAISAPPSSAPVAVVIAPPATAPKVTAPAVLDARSLPVATRTMRVTAKEGMRIEVVHGTQTVILRVQDGEFIVEDSAGVQVAFGGQ